MYISSLLNRKISALIGIIVVLLVAVFFGTIIIHQFQQLMAIRTEIID